METIEQTSTPTQPQHSRSSALIDMLRYRPLAVFSASFITGVLLSSIVPPYIAAVIGFIIGIALLFKYHHSVILCLTGIVCIGISCGILRSTAYNEIDSDDVSIYSGQGRLCYITGTVANDPEYNKGRVILLLDAKTVDSNPATGQVYVTIRDKGDRGHKPEYGDLISIHGLLSKPRPAGNPGGFSWRDYLARRRIYCTLFARGNYSVSYLGNGGANPFLHLAWTVRNKIRTAVISSVSPLQSSIMLGIMIGQRTNLPARLSADFVNTGTVHILASAGLHVGILALGLLFLFERITLPRKFSASLMILILWIYAVMCGGRPSVTRAVIMATVYFAAILFERDPDLPTTIALAALIILINQPSAIFDTAFQLSFTTVITLIVTMPVWNNYILLRIKSLAINPWVKRVLLKSAELTGLSLMAQIGAAPIVASAYNEVSIGGVIANLLVVPALFVIIPIGIIGSLLWYAWTWGGAIVLKLNSFFVLYVNLIVQFFGETRYSYIAVQSPSLLIIVIYYLLIYICAYFLLNRSAMCKVETAP